VIFLSLSQETTTPPTPRIKLRGWVKLILALIATLAVLLALYYLFGRVSPGKLYTINAVCQVLLIVAGVVMALKAEEAAKYQFGS